MNNHSNKIYPKQKGQKTSFKPNPKLSYIISSIKNNNDIKKNSFIKFIFLKISYKINTK